jgi:hypothetical protein
MLSELEVTATPSTKFQPWKQMVTVGGFERDSFYAMKADSNGGVRTLNERDDKG